MMIMEISTNVAGKPNYLPEKRQANLKYLPRMNKSKCFSSYEQEIA
jgi:hypothetical protein